MIFNINRAMSNYGAHTGWRTKGGEKRGKKQEKGGGHWVNRKGCVQRQAGNPENNSRWKNQSARGPKSMKVKCKTDC